MLFILQAIKAGDKAGDEAILVYICLFNLYGSTPSPETWSGGSPSL